MADTGIHDGKGKRWGAFIGVIIVTAIVTALIAALLVNIFQRKQEGKNPYLKLVEVTENTSDPAVWGTNWPLEFDQYKRTVDATHTRYGGSEAMPEQKLEQNPWLRRLYAGYAFSIDYRERRGHAYMLYDQEQTERVLKKPQPGACLHCHASVIPTYRRLGASALGTQVSSDAFAWDAVMKGFEIICGMKYSDAHAELLKTPDGSPNEPAPAPGGSSVAAQTPANAPTTQQALSSHVGQAHPVSCVDCHDPNNMELRVTRPGFVNGIKALKASQGVKDYDPNRDATRQEMRSFVCGQCHVEYYFKGDGKLVTFPWHKGLKVEEIESYYDEVGFNDWKHAETGAQLIKAQHPEFELWNQGVHARAGVACADCHMPYMRQGALKVSDHYIRSPLLMINRSCQTCHRVPEEELEQRVHTIQDRTHALMQRSAVALTDMIDAINLAKANGATDQQLAPAFAMHRKAGWRLDFVQSENSMGFHASQETARILGESIDYARQGQIAAQQLVLQQNLQPATPPATTIQGVTPADKAPPGSGTR